jgi:hypothetical protein
MKYLQDDEHLFMTSWFESSLLHNRLYEYTNEGHTRHGNIFYKEIFATNVKETQKSTNFPYPSRAPTGFPLPNVLFGFPPRESTYRQNFNVFPPSMINSHTN